MLQSVNLKSLRTACSSCSLHELCLPAGLDAREIEHLDRLINAKQFLKRGEYLYRAGGKFQSLYAVRAGFFKTATLLGDGREQVTGFHMTGK